MTIFAVLMPTPQQPIVDAIKREFSADHLMLNDTQYLVSATGTAQDLSVKLGLYHPQKSETPPVGSAVVLASSAYFGRAPSNVWEWMKVKLEASNG